MNDYDDIIYVTEKGVFVEMEDKELEQSFYSFEDAKGFIEKKHDNDKKSKHWFKWFET